MTAKGRGRSPSALKAGRRLTYEEIRDRFVAEPPESDSEALDYFMRIGLYVFSRWEAIAADCPDGEMTEDGSARWDECTEGEFDEIRTKAQRLIDREVARQRVKAFVARIFEEPWGSIVKGFSWVFMRAWEGFISAIGILVFGLLFVWLAPNVAKQIRSAIDDALPHETRPGDGAIVSPADQNVANAAETRP